MTRMRTKTMADNTNDNMIFIENLNECVFNTPQFVILLYVRITCIEIAD